MASLDASGFSLKRTRKVVSAGEIPCSLFATLTNVIDSHAGQSNIANRASGRKGIKSEINVVKARCWSSSSVWALELQAEVAAFSSRERHLSDNLSSRQAWVITRLVVSILTNMLSSKLSLALVSALIHIVQYTAQASLSSASLPSHLSNVSAVVVEHNLAVIHDEWESAEISNRLRPNGLVKHNAYTLPQPIPSTI